MTIIKCLKYFFKIFFQVRALRHPNVSPLIGICLDPNNSFILTPFCNHGSLQDVLANDMIKVDWIFQVSFASDVAKVILNDGLTQIPTSVAELVSLFVH